MSTRIANSIVALAVSAFVAGTTLTAVAAAPAISSNPLRDAYYGDLHLHTSYSLDAYLGGAMQIDPDAAYRFARGEVVDFSGQPMQRREPLDFLAVTDHSEALGVANQLDDPASAFSRSETGKALLAIVAKMTRKDGRADIEQLADKPRELSTLYGLSQDVAWGLHDRRADIVKPAMAGAWAREIEAANRNYAPGRFTTFIAYEWNGSGAATNLHRNVIFRGATAPAPFTAWDSRYPEDLWDWLDTIRAKGFDTLAIPHNSNASDGYMFHWLDSSSGSINARHASARQKHEPVAEIAQNKGSSETHPLLSPNDEFADYEIFDYMAGDRRLPGHPQGSYLRDALSRGLLLQSEAGVNPFKYGLVGGSDLHSGLSVSAQADYAGNYYTANIGAGRPNRNQAASIVRDGPERAEHTLYTTSGSLTGVWAESNTRESIHDALRRREAFATSGSRLKFRFFGGWGLDDTLLRDADFVRAAYQLGVPMGGDLPAAPTAGANAPAFAIWAIKDPAGANLDRIQIVKVWVENGQQQEQVFDVAWAGDRRPDAATGALPAVGDSVDLKTAAFTNTIGAVELKVVWKDADFDPRQLAAWYLRVLEIPTPRWSTLLAVQAGVPPPAGVPATTQQRGWSSPIWYTPP